MKKKTQLYLALASLAERYQNICRQHALGHNPGAEHCHDEFYRLVKEHLPSGSGFDSGTTIDIGHVTSQAMSFGTSFHHMDEHGAYDGWTDHVVRIRATFGGFDLQVTGRDRNSIKDYIADIFTQALTQEVEYQPLPAKEAA